MRVRQLLIVVSAALLIGTGAVSAQADTQARGVIPTEDKVIPPAAQRFMAKRAGSKVKEIKSSHVVMISHPAAATAVILSAYAATR